VVDLWNVENTFSHKMQVHGIGIMHSQNPQVALSYSRSGGSLERLKLVKMKEIFGLLQRSCQQ
jgi:hypothetical protein